MNLNELEIHRLGQNRVCWTCGDSRILSDEQTLDLLDQAVKLTRSYRRKISEGNMHIFKNEWPDKGPKAGWKFMLSAVKEMDELYAYVTIHTPSSFGFCAPYFIAEKVE